jgi:hypothetical protein
MLFYAHFHGDSKLCERKDGTAELVLLQSRVVAQLVEQRSPKPQVAGSSPVRPAAREVPFGADRHMVDETGRL